MTKLQYMAFALLLVAGNAAASGDESPVVSEGRVSRIARNLDGARRAGRSVGQRMGDAVMGGLERSGMIDGCVYLSGVPVVGRRWTNKGKFAGLLAVLGALFYGYTRVKGYTKRRAAERDAEAAEYGVAVAAEEGYEL